jgi:hypothetical protein
MMKNLESTDLEVLLDGATLIDRPPKNDILRSTKNSVDEVGTESILSIFVPIRVSSSLSVF